MLNTTETALDSQKFYHIVGVINTDEQQTNLYVNGINSVTNTTYGYNPTSNDYDLLLGVRENYQLGGGFDNFFNGIIDDIKIFNKPLTNCEVLSLFNEGTLNYPSLQELYITQDNNILSASLYASSYNWYLNGELLIGLNTKEIELIENGNYQVQAVTDDCISELSNFYILSNKELSTRKFRVYPNPSSTYVKLDSNSEFEIQQISLYSISGKMVQIENSDRMVFNNTIQQGFYFLKVEFENKEIAYKQIVIE